MSFLGYEKPVEYTGYQIFDPTMAKMILDAQDKYFNAVYADYQQGLEDMKEFKKEYYDFDTPILADQDWYNRNVTGKVRNFINDAYARGIDLTRSPEGRAAIAQLINSVDVGKVAKLRSSAENAKEFLKARKALEAQGLYNPLLAKYDGPDMSTYSTLNQGIWDKMSPTPYQNMATFGNPYFEGMKPNVRRESKNGVEYSVESITADDLMNIANNHFNELVSTPQGSLMYKYYLDQADGNAEAARMMFNSAVAAGQQRRIYEKSDYDDQWIKHQQIAQGWKKIAQDEKELQIKAWAAGMLGDNPNAPGVGGPTPLDRQVKYSVDKKVSDNIGITVSSDGNVIPSADGARTRVENVNKIIEHYQKLMDDIAKQKGKKIQDGYEEVEETVSRPMTPQMLAQGISSTYTTTKKVPKYRYEYDGKNDPLYKKYQEKIDYYRRHPDGTSNPFSKVEKDRYLYLKNKEVTEKLTDHEQKALNVLQTKLNNTFNAQAKTYMNDFVNIYSNKHHGGNEFASTNDRFYGMFEFQPQNEAGVKTALGIFTGHTQQKEISNLPGKYNVVNFKDSGIQYAPVRKAGVSGPRRYKYNSLQSRFNRFLQSGKEGVMLNTSASFASIPKEYSTSGANQLDVTAYPSISVTQFMDFYNNLPLKDKEGVKEVARKLGLVVRQVESTLTDPTSKDQKIPLTYYDVPTIKTVDNHEGFAYSQMNNEYDKELYGAAKAYDTTPNNESSSLTPYILKNIILEQ